MDKQNIQTDVNNAINERVMWLEDRYATFNAEMGKVQTDVSWLIWITRWIVAGIGGTLFIALINLVLALAIK